MIHLPDNSFAGACYDQNSLTELMEPHAPEDADVTDCKIWDLTPEQWSKSIELALQAKIEAMK